VERRYEIIMKKNWYLFIPFCILFSIVFLFPLGRAIWYSFTSYSVVTAPVFIGVNNYLRLLQDQLFKNSVVNFTMISLTATVIAVLISFFIYRGTKNFSKPVKVIAGIVLTSFSAFSFVPVTLPYFFSRDSYGLINSFLLTTNNIFTNMRLIEKPINFLGDPVLASILVVLLTSIASVAPMYILFNSIEGSMSKKLIIAVNTGVITAVLITFLQVPVFGLPSENYVVHTPLVHMYDYGFIRFEVGYMYALMIVTILITLILSGFLSLLFYFAGKIKLKENPWVFTKIISGILIALNALSVIVLLIFSISKIFQPISERLLFPAKFFVRNPTLENITGFFERGPWKEVLTSLIVQSIFGLIVFAVVALPAAFAISKSKSVSKFIVPGIIISVILSIMPLGILVVKSYSALGFLSAALTPFLILSIFFVSKSFSVGHYISGIIGGVLLVLFGSFTNTGIIRDYNNPGLINILISQRGADYFSPFLIFGIILITAVLASIFIGVAQGTQRDGSAESLTRNDSAEPSPLVKIGGKQN